MSDVQLETEFEKINLDEGPCKPKDDKKSMMKQIEHTNTGSSLKVKERRKNLIKPARLKLIGTCWARKTRNSIQDEVSSEEKPSTVIDGDLDTFASDAFLKMRITSHEPMNQPPDPSPDKSSQTSQPNSCSAQAKLQQQLSSSEFDSTIDEMSEFLGYHLNLYAQDKNFLVNSMYT